MMTSSEPSKVRAANNTHTHTKYKNTHTHTQAIQKHTHAYAHTHTHIHIHAHTRTYTHIYTHILTHTHTHAHTSSHVKFVVDSGLTPGHRIQCRIIRPREVNLCHGYSAALSIVVCFVHEIHSLVSFSCSSWSMLSLSTHCLVTYFSPCSTPFHKHTHTHTHTTGRGRGR